MHNNIIRTRLQNYPQSQLYQTQVIDYPGSVGYTGQQQQQQQQPNYMTYMQVQPQPNWIQTQQQPNYAVTRKIQQPKYVQSQTQPNYIQNQQTIQYQQDYQPVAQTIPEYQQVQTVSAVPITTTTTTTPEPIVVNEQVEEEVPIHVPAVRAPIRSQTVRRVRYLFFLDFYEFEIVFS